MPPSRHRRRSAARRSARRTPPITTGANRSRVRRWLYISASSLIAILVIAGFAIGGIPLGGGGGDSQQGRATAYIPGIGHEVDVIDDVTHFSEEFTISDIVDGGYSTTPPTSGRHWGRWASCGFYRNGIQPDTEPVPDEVIVHNMEHGNIILSYNITDEAQVDTLEADFNSIGDARLWGVARYYDKIPEGQIVLTTWGVIDQWNLADAGIDPRTRMGRFFDAYSGALGPEFPNGSPCTSGGSMNP